MGPALIKRLTTIYLFKKAGQTVANLHTFATNYLIQNNGSATKKSC